MEKEIFIKNGFDMIYLSACALHSVVPTAERIEKMDLLEVYRISSRHSLQSVTYFALESFFAENPEYCDKISKELLKEWKFMKSKTLRNIVLYDEERNKLTEFLEENKIWYSCLKGIVMQKYYPKIEMRRMCDNDILIDPKARKDVYDYMINSGYEVVLSDAEYHDEYRKAPSIVFEMHETLYNQTIVEKPFYDYYLDVKSKLIKDTDNDYGYHFSDEDYYIHMITHAYKHYANAGNGLRSLMDIYVYMCSKGDSLNFDYILKELKKLGISDFECDIRKLAEKLFSRDIINSVDYDSQLNDKEKDLYFYHLFSGKNGNKVNYIKNKVKNGIEYQNRGKFKYIFSRIFPGKEFYQKEYPRLYKYKVTIPFIVLYRVVTRIFIKFREIKYELKTLFKGK